MIAPFSGKWGVWHPWEFAGRQYLVTSTETEGGLCRACVCVRTYLRPYVLSPDLPCRSSGNRNEEESDGCLQKAAPLLTPSAKKSANGTIVPCVVAAFFSRIFSTASSPTFVSSSPPTRVVLNRRIFLRQVGGRRFVVKSGLSPSLGSRVSERRPCGWHPFLLLGRTSCSSSAWLVCTRNPCKTKEEKRSKHGAV